MAMDRADLIRNLQAQIDSVAVGKRAKRTQPAAKKARSIRKGKTDAVEKPKDEKAAFDKIVALVNASDKSELMVRERLMREDFPADVIDDAVGRAKSYRIIDDAHYADILIRSRISQQKGSNGIELELKKCGIDPADVEGWPQEYDVGYDAEFDRAMSLLRHHPVRTKDLRAGAYRRLIQKGYPANLASSVSRLYQEEMEVVED